jgi:uncharacterized membrane protein
MEERERINALIHLYRGELGRMTAYRLRLDTTTNWAVGTTAALGSFALGAASPAHFVLLLLVLLLFFLWMESRRYQNFRLIFDRVRLLETGMYLPVLGQTGRADWQEQLARSLEAPENPVPLWRAISIRLRRNYLGLAVIVVAMWLFRVAEAGDPLRDAAMGAVPGSLVLAAVAVLVTGLVGLALVGPRSAEEG